VCCVCCSALLCAALLCGVMCCAVLCCAVLSSGVPERHHGGQALQGLWRGRAVRHAGAAGRLGEHTHTHTQATLTTSNTALQTRLRDTAYVNSTTTTATTSTAADAITYVLPLMLQPMHFLLSLLLHGHCISSFFSNPGNYSCSLCDVLLYLISENKL
jgi:hypothetical protein